MAFLRRTMGAAALVVCLSPLMANAQELAAPNRVPENVTMVFSINDTNGLWAALSQTPVREQVDKFMALPSLKDNPDLGEAGAILSGIGTELGMEMTADNMLGKVVKGWDFYMVGNPESEPQIVMAVKMDSAEHASKLADFMLKKASEVTDQADAIEETTMQEGAEGETAAEATPEVTPAAPLPIATEKIGSFDVRFVAEQEAYVTVDGSTVIIGSSHDVMTSSLTAGKKENLTASEGYASAVAPLAKSKGQVFFWVDADGAMEAAGETPENSNVKVGDTAMLLNFMADRVEGTTFSQVGYAGAVAKLMDIANTAQDGLLSFGDDKGILSISTNLLDGKAIQAILDEKAAADPDFKTSLDETEADMQSQAGISLKEDVLKAFGPDAGFFISSLNVMNMMAPQADMNLVLQVQDKEKALKIAGIIEQMILSRSGGMDPAAGAAPAAQEEVYNGTKVRMMDIPGQMGTPMTICHALTEDNYWVLSSSKAGVHNAIDSHKNKASVFGGELGSKAKTTLPGTHNGVMVLNLRGFGNVLAGIAPMMLGMSGASQQDMEIATQSIELLKSMGTMYATMDSAADGHLTRFTVVMK